MKVISLESFKKQLDENRSDGMGRAEKIRICTECACKYWLFLNDNDKVYLECAECGHVEFSE